jgi:hypothetical protein
LPVTVEVSPYLYEPLAEPGCARCCGHLDLERLTTDPRAAPGS